MNLNNAKTNAFQRKRIRLASAVSGPLGGAYCIPESTMTSVRKKAGASPLSGFHVTQVVSESLPTPRARYGNNVANFPGLGLLGEGNNGTVYLGYWGPSSAGNAMAIKIGDHLSVNKEAKILKTLKGVSPHIPALYMHHTAAQCKAEASKLREGKNPLMNFHRSARQGEPQSIMYSEYASGGNLETFFAKFGNALRSVDIKCIAFQVLWTIAAIQKKIPTFRHGDMIVDNILMDVEHHNAGTIRYDGGFTVPNRGYRVLIGDFGLAQANRDGMKASASVNLKNSHGVGPNMMKGYDAHLFLENMAAFLRDYPKAGEFRAWLKTVIPAKFHWSEAPTKKFNSTYLVGGRLKHGLGSDIPSAVQMLSTSYFADFKKPTFVAKGSWPRSSMVRPVPVLRVKGRKKVRGPKVAPVAMPSAVDNKNFANKINKFVKNERGASPKLRPMRRARANRASKPVLVRKEVNLNKVANLFAPVSPVVGKQVNVRKKTPGPENARLAYLRALSPRTRAAIGIPLRKNQMGLEPRFLSDPKVMREMERMEAAEVALNANAKKKANALANLQVKGIKEMMNALNLNENEVKAFVNTSKILRNQRGILKNKAKANANAKKVVTRNVVEKKLTKGSSKLPEPAAGVSRVSFYKNILRKIDSKELGKLPVSNLRKLANVVMKDPYNSKMKKSELVNMLSNANNSNMASNSPVAAVAPRARKANSPAAVRVMPPLPIMDNIRSRLGESYAALGLLKPQTATLSKTNAVRLGQKYRKKM